jgi:hypothetical protein
VDYTNSDTWKHLWTAFSGAWLVMGPSIVAIVIGVWWVRGKVNDREIGGLKGEISVKNGEISLLERQLKDAVAKSAASDTAKDEVERRLKILEAAIMEAKADNASIIALASQVQSAVEAWGKAQNEVSNAVSQSRNTNTTWFDSTKSGSGGARSGLGMVPPGARGMPPPMPPQPLVPPVSSWRNNVDKQE